MNNQMDGNHNSNPIVIYPSTIGDFGNQGIFGNQEKAQASKMKNLSKLFSKEMRIIRLYSYK
jgi:hypothetical protein